MTEIRNMETVPWIEKYRPKNMEHVVQNKDLIELFKNCISTREMPHWMFYGPPGTGKTSVILAMSREIFKEYFSERVIEFNASEDRGINAVREKITQVAKKSVSQVISKDGTIIPAYKIIILDEADSMTDEAQDALRVVIEKYSTVTRFCFIGNYISKITDAIKSRCALVYFKKISINCMVNKLNEIAVCEEMKLPDKIFLTLINVAEGDMRKAIMLLQNMKYVYEQKKDNKKTFAEMTDKELSHITILKHKPSTRVTESDVYKIAATISLKTASKIIHEIIECKTLREIMYCCKNIVASGYPIDNILLQLNMAVMRIDILTDYQKAIILRYTGTILLKMKECANEYIQLLDYMSCIHNVNKGNTTPFE